MKQPRAAVIAFFLLAVVMFATAQDNAVSVTIRAFVVAEDGSLTESTTAQPGDIVEYRVVATNTTGTTLPAETVTINAPVPRDTQLIRDSLTNAPNFLLEYSEDDGQTFVHAARRETNLVRWTLKNPMEPDETFDFVYRVQLDEDTSRPETYQFENSNEQSSSGSGSAAEFTQAMFGHLGVIQVDCQSANAAVCGQTTSSFDLFRQGWDLYSDIEDEVPVIPTPLNAWQLNDGAYSRAYNLNGDTYIVIYVEGDDGGFVGISY